MIKISFLHFTYPISNFFFIYFEINFSIVKEKVNKNYENNFYEIVRQRVASRDPPWLVFSFTYFF